MNSGPAGCRGNHRRGGTDPDANSQTSARPNSGLPTAPRSHSTACFAPPQIADPQRTLDLAWRASAALYLLGPSPQHLLHGLRPFIHRCPASPARTWDPPALSLPAAPALWATSPRVRAARTAVALSPLALGPGSERLGDVCVSEICPGPQALPVALPKPNWRSYSCSLGLPHVCPLLQPNPQPERVVPAAGCAQPGQRRGVRVWALCRGTGERGEGSRCSLAAAVSAPVLAWRARSSPRRCTPGRGAGQHGLRCRCLAWAVKRVNE